MYHDIHINTVNSVCTAVLGDIWDMTYDFFKNTGLNILTFHPNCLKIFTEMICECAVTKYKN